MRSSLNHSPSTILQRPQNEALNAVSLLSLPTLGSWRGLLESERLLGGCGHVEGGVGGVVEGAQGAGQGVVVGGGGGRSGAEGEHGGGPQALAGARLSQQRGACNQGPMVTTVFKTAPTFSASFTVLYVHRNHKAY